VAEKEAIVRSLERSNVWAWPDERIEFVDDHPGRDFIEAESLLHRQGKYHAGLRRGRRRMGNGRYIDDRLIRLSLDS
jgi:hypothetical protein